MTVSKIQYFGTVNDSLYGILRGLVSFLILFPLTLIFTFMRKNKNNSTVGTILSSILISLVLCSSLGVQISYGQMESVQYGFLVGLVVSTFACCMEYILYAKYPMIKYVMFIITVCTVLMICSLLTYNVSTFYNIY